MEICWLTTAKCNQHCNYCDRFKESGHLSYRDYHTISLKLADYGVKQLTFGGGESLMVSCFSDIVYECKKNNIKLKLVTNGKLIPQNSKLIKFFDEITISIDSLIPNINEQLGRGIDHLDIVCDAIKTIQVCSPEVRININSVVTQINKECVKYVSDLFNDWGISQWRIFRFCPLRGTALRNTDLFSLTEAEFEAVKHEILNLSLRCRVQFRNHIDMEKKYLLITPKGELCVSCDMKDVIVGDMLKDDLKVWFQGKML